MEISKEGNGFLWDYKVTNGNFQGREWVPLGLRCVLGSFKKRIGFSGIKR